MIHVSTTLALVLLWSTDLLVLLKVNCLMWGIAGEYQEDGKRKIKKKNKPKKPNPNQPSTSAAPPPKKNPENKTTPKNPKPNKKPHKNQKPPNKTNQKTPTKYTKTKNAQRWNFKSKRISRAKNFKILHSQHIGAAIYYMFPFSSSPPRL